MSAKGIRELDLRDLQVEQRTISRVSVRGSAWRAIAQRNKSYPGIKAYLPQDHIDGGFGPRCVSHPGV